MKYKINNQVLAADERTLHCGDKIKKVRPRTLKLLLYLIDQHGKIVSKEELLSSVWPDVSVDEGVIFQSISEIRKLFENSKIIISHPRQGYQFVAEVEPLSKKHTPAIHWRALYSGAGVLVLALVMTVFYGLFLDEKSIDESIEQRILILPIQNKIEYEDRRWLSLGGMDYVITSLQEQLTQAYTFDTEETLAFMAEAGLPLNSQPTDIARLLALSGATDAVSIQFVGKNLEYTLAVSLLSKTNQTKKVVFAKTIEEGLANAVNEILRQLDGAVDGENKAVKDEFKNELFAEAMLAYQTDWQTAVSFFESYLKIDPDSVIANMYLMRLYIWLDNQPGALAIYRQLNQLTNLTGEEKARLTLYRAMISFVNKEYQAALDWLAHAEKGLPSVEHSLLGARIHSVTGEVLLAKGEYNNALKYFKKSLGFYQATGKLIDICAIKLKMAQTYYLAAQTEQAIEYLTAAKQAITQFEIVFLLSELEKTESIVTK